MDFIMVFLNILCFYFPSFLINFSSLLLILAGLLPYPSSLFFCFGVACIPLYSLLPLSNTLFSFLSHLWFTLSFHLYSHISAHLSIFHISREHIHTVFIERIWCSLLNITIFNWIWFFTLVIVSLFCGWIKFYLYSPIYGNLVWFCFGVIIYSAKISMYVQVSLW